MHSLKEGLVGHWKLRDDCKDHSGSGNHGVNHGVDHGVDLQAAAFDGHGHYIEVPDSPSLQVGTDDFSVCGWIFTERDVEGVPGDLVTKFDPSLRRGFNLGLSSASGGYNSSGTDRRLSFSIDDAKDGAWQDCGKPSPVSPIVTSLTVFDGGLFVGNNYMGDPAAGSRVFRYAGGQQWDDWGHVGLQETQGVGPMIVHNGDLYAATWNFQTHAPASRRGQWTPSATEPPPQLTEFPSGRVYRYQGGQDWEDCGQPGHAGRLMSLASFRGTLYVMAVDDGAAYVSRCYAYAGGQRWVACHEFTNRVFAATVHDGRLFVSQKSAPGIDEAGGARVFAFDGEHWQDMGVPLEVQSRCAEIHCLTVFGDAVHAGTNPLGRIARLRNETWEDLGELGDSREPTAFAAYNGMLFGGSLQWADVYRYNGAQRWTLLRRFLEEDINPGSRIPGILIPRGLKNRWVRPTSLTVFDGELFAAIGSCWGHFDGEHGIRGRVYRFRAGQTAAFDRDIGPGWRHVAAVKSGRQLKLYVNAVRTADSDAFDPADYSLSCTGPLKLGGGEVGSFRGRLRDVRFYKRALAESEIAELHRGSIIDE